MGNGIMALPKGRCCPLFIQSTLHVAAKRALCFVADDFHVNGVEHDSEQDAPALFGESASAMPALAVLL